MTDRAVVRPPPVGWAILTGEYPPQRGGVADYTRLVAEGLATAGDRVTVFAPPAVGPCSNSSGVTVRRLPDHFGPRGLLALDRELANLPGTNRILVQYVPHAYGWKGMNLPFAVWVVVRAHRFAQVWVMFHEVLYPVIRGQPVRHRVLARVTRMMAKLLAQTADRVFVSTPPWGELLRRAARMARPAEWLPVPSNVATAADTARVTEVRAGLARHPDGVILGHFGTFGCMNADLLAAAFAETLRRSDAIVGLLVGRNGEAFHRRFTEDYPDLTQRIMATGELTADEVSAHLAACDLLLQPYPDGINTRRGSAMAGLALGVPIVTNVGRLSEPIWEAESTGVTVVSSTDPGVLASAATAVLALPPNELAARGRLTAAWYRSHFSLEHTVARLRGSTSNR